MRLVFDPHLPHQRAAIDAVLDAVDVGDPLARLTAVQRRAGLPASQQLAWLDPPEGSDGRRFANYSVEMETGTGKTYVYLRTILELAAREGPSPWLIVVPSVAVREGVLQTLRATRDHFRALLPHVPYRFWAYDGRPDRVRALSRHGETVLGVLTIDAFNREDNRLRRPDDRFGGRPPLEVIRDARPGLVLDEPQHYESPLARRVLTELHPRFALRYGATHRHAWGLLHRLTPQQAHAQGLVKRIEVASLPAGPDDDEARFSAQVAQTIRRHLVRQAALRRRGIKVLSLFFVDSVASYAADDGLARRLFDHHYQALRHLDPGAPALPPARVRAAYFATKARRGEAEPIDSRTGRSAADAAAYALIMRDKTRLLSLDEPVAFVFSHSALREGWDNPNVFQVCTLGRRGSAVRRRQELGRGIRLCVDREGHRVHDPAIDVLTVIPSEPYDEYVERLQAETEAGPSLPEPPGAAPPVDEPSDMRSDAPLEAPEVDPEVGPDALWMAGPSREALIDRAAAHLHPRLAALPPGTPPETFIDLVALVTEHLARHRVTVTPRTILGLLTRADPRARLWDNPHQAAASTARALLDALRPAP